MLLCYHPMSMNARYISGTRSSLFHLLNTLAKKPGVNSTLGHFRAVSVISWSWQRQKCQILYIISSTWTEYMFWISPVLDKPIVFFLSLPLVICFILIYALSSCTESQRRIFWWDVNKFRFTSNIAKYSYIKQVVFDLLHNKGEYIWGGYS